MRTTRKVVIGIGLLAVLLLLAAVALPYLIDAKQFRPVIQAQLQKRLHRSVSLGDMQLKVFPLAIRISDVVIGEPEGFTSTQPFLEAKEVYVGVALLPLLRKDVSIDAVRLTSPRIELIRNPAGVWNYETGGSEPADSSTSNLTLDELRVEDGQVALQDQKAATPRDVYEHIDVTLKGLGAGRRGSLTGSVRLDTMAAALSVNSDFEMADAITAKGTLTLKSDRNKDSLDVTYDIRRDASGALAINSLNAKIGALSASATGSVEAQRTPIGLRLDIKTANAPIADILRIAGLYGARFPEGLKADGLLTADIQVTGTAEKPLLAGKIEATKAQITAKDIAEPVRASELLIDLTPDSLTTHPFTVETGATRLTAQATVANYSGSTPKIDATLQTKGARVEELLRMASAYGVKPAGLTGTGVVNLDMKISETGKTLSYSGSGSLRDVSLSSPDLPKTLTVAAADLKFADDRIAFDHLQAALGSMHLDGSCSVRDFAKPRIQFDAHIDQVNVAELREWSGSSTSNGKKSKSPTEISANGTLAVGKIQYDQMVLSSVKATVSFANSVLRLDPVTAVVFGGQESGSITANLRDPTAAYAIKTKLTNVDANQLLSSTTSLKGVLSGALSGNVDLQFLSKPNEDIAKTLNGNVRIQMGQGRLAGVHILNEIASIGRFLGYTKKPEVSTNIVKLTGGLNIQNGLASTNDLFMDLGDGTLSGAGTMGLVDQTLKLKITTVVGKDFAQKNGLGQIGGLLSTVLANQKGELVVPAIVTGTFAQPKFAPDAEQIASMKLKGLLPTANNPTALTSGIKGIVDAFTGQKSDAKSGDTPQGGILDIIDQFRKKKPENKQ